MIDRRKIMARIIESSTEFSRRIIKLSAEDIISVVKDYQRIVPRNIGYEDVFSYLTDAVVFLPEDV